MILNFLLVLAELLLHLVQCGVERNGGIRVCLCGHKVMPMFRINQNFDC